MPLRIAKSCVFALLMSGMLLAATDRAVGGTTHAFVDVTAGLSAHHFENGDLSASDSISASDGRSQGSASVNGPLSADHHLTLGTRGAAVSETGQGIARWTDIISINSPSPRTLTFVVKVHGSLEAHAEVPPAVVPPGFYQWSQASASHQVKFTVNGVSGIIGTEVVERWAVEGNKTVFSGGSPSDSSGGEFNPSWSGLNDNVGIGAFHIDINGSLGTEVQIESMSAANVRGETDQGGFAFADFGNTLQLIAILLPDGNTPESEGYTLTFESGLISPNLVSQGVPEPSTLIISSILFGMFGVVWSYRRLNQAKVAA